MGLNKYRKGGFTSSAVTFHQKSNFDFLNPFKNISGYPNLDNLEWVFFHKIMVVEKITFLKMQNTILQRVE